ncbi:MAG: Ig-like domain-containing protein, partial [Acutalibacteraceae bacterium]
MKKLVSVLLITLILAGTISFIVPVYADENNIGEPSFSDTSSQVSEDFSDADESTFTDVSAFPSETTQTASSVTEPAISYNFSSLNKSISGKVKSNSKYDYYFNMVNSATYQLYFKHTGKNYPHLGIAIYSIDENGKETRVFRKTIIFDEVKTITNNIKLDKGIYRVCIDNTVDVLPVANTFVLKLTKYTRVPSSVKFTVSKITLKYKNTKKLAPYDKYNNLISSSIIKYTTSNKKVASVSSSGTVKALWQGSATITAKLKNGKKATIKVVVPKLTLAQKLSSTGVNTTVNYVYTSGKKALVGLTVNNNSNSNIKRVYVDFAEY